MTYIYLVRHCEAMGNHKRLFQGSTDCDVSEIGTIQLKYLKENSKNILYSIAIFVLAIAPFIGCTTYGIINLDDYCYEDKDGDCCCDKTKEEVEGDISEYQENMMNDMKLLAEEMEKQWIANYDFERGDVKY